MTEVLNRILAHNLATNEAIPANLAHVLYILHHQNPIQLAERDEGLSGPVLNRWNLRLASLIAPSLPFAVRTAGFKILHSTFASSTTSLLSQSKQALLYATNIINAANPDPQLFEAALELILQMFALSTWHAEWAREVVGAATVQKTVQSLVKVAGGEHELLRYASVSAIVTLIPLFPTPLRPLSPSLHILAISLICGASTSSNSIDAGADLFVSLYLLSPKGKDGLREAWKTGVEALIGSIDVLVPLVTSEIFAEDPLLNHTLAPLALPQLYDPSPFSGLARMEALAQVLCLILRTPTSDRTGAVEIPVGALVELGVRLVGLNSNTPVKERTDPTTLSLTMSLTPRLQMIGCEILAQTAMCVGARLSANAPEVVGALSRTLATYPLRLPMRSVLSTTFSLVVDSLKASLDPEEGAKSFARVWRSVLEDIGAIAIEPVAIPVSEDKGRQNKRQKTYDPSESMDLTGKRVRLDEGDLLIAERALSTLERLLLSPFSHFLPPKLKLSTSRLLLTLSLDPTFFASHAVSTSATNPIFFPNNSATTATVSASKGVDVAKMSIGFRRGVLRCLKSALVGESSAAAEGLVERALEVWKQGCTDTDLEIKSLSVSALSTFTSLIHPSLPPLQVNSTIARLKSEQSGGPIGDEEEVFSGATEFRPQAIEPPSVHSAMEVDVEATPIPVPPQSLVQSAPAPASSFASTSSSSGFGSVNGFASFSTSFAAKPAITVSKASQVVTSSSSSTLEEVTKEEKLEEEAVKPIPVATFSGVSFSSEAPVREVAKETQKRVNVQATEEDSDDDEPLPQIVMSDDEEE